MRIKRLKKIAHLAFDTAYRNYYGDVKPFEEGVEKMLQDLRQLDLRVGALTNRSREFMEKELELVSEDGWSQYFHSVVCGDDVEKRKPAPDQIFKSLKDLGEEANLHCWYVGDSTTDIIAAKEAGITGIFYNGANWSEEWINKIFPGTVSHPHRPDAVVNNFRELMHFVRLEKFMVSE